MATKSVVSTKKLQEIANGFSISYYTDSWAGSLRIDEQAETHFFDLINGNITLSSKLINEVLANVTGGNACTDVELIRHGIAHELGHFICTPKSTKGPDGVPFDFLNIAEDERLETYLQDFYLDVDFKKVVKAINGEPNKYKPFFVIRYRKDFGNDANSLRLLEEFIDNTHDDMGDADTFSDNYKKRLKALYESFPKPPQPPQPPQPPEGPQGPVGPGGKPGQGPGGKPGQGQQPGEGKEPGQGQQPGKDQQPGEGKEPGQSAGQQGGQVQNGGGDPGDPNAKASGTELGGKGMRARAEISNQFKKMIAKARKEQAEKARQKVEALDWLPTLLQQLKTNRERPGYIGYSPIGGKLNPMRAWDDKCNWFEKTSGDGAIGKKFDKVKINFWIDSSGSFVSNFNSIDMLRAVLRRTATKYPNLFEYDVFNVTANTEKDIIPGRTWKERSSGGTPLIEEIQTYYKAANKVAPGTKVINFVLYDGAMCNPDRLRYFNDKSARFIIDSSCEHEVKTFAPAAKYIVTHNYCGELFGAIRTSLTNFVRENS